jgi:hypothetical protein
MTALSSLRGERWPLSSAVGTSSASLVSGSFRKREQHTPSGAFR